MNSMSTRDLPNFLLSDSLSSALPTNDIKYEFLKFGMVKEISKKYTVFLKATNAYKGKYKHDYLDQSKFGGCVPPRKNMTDRQRWAHTVFFAHTRASDNLVSPNSHY
jgi:hypothetical protein